jgi:hypothetical protein
VPSLQVLELSQPSPLKWISSRDSDERRLRKEKQITHQNWQEAIIPEKIDMVQDEYNESMDRLYTGEYNKIREEKVIKFS